MLAGNPRQRLDEIRSKQVVVAKKSRKKGWSDAGEVDHSNA